MMEPRQCQECGEALRGRIDQRFCSDQCRSTYHNRRKAPSELMRRINSTLRANHRILKAANPSGKTRISGRLLRAQGFNFHYFTHQHLTQNGHTYCFIYEQGYLALEQDSYLLVVNETYKA